MAFNIPSNITCNTSIRGGQPSEAELTAVLEIDQQRDKSISCTAQRYDLGRSIQVGLGLGLQLCIGLHQTVHWLLALEIEDRGFSTDILVVLNGYKPHGVFSAPCVSLIPMIDSSQWCDQKKLGSGNGGVCSICRGDQIPLCLQIDDRNRPWLSGIGCDPGMFGR